MLLLHEFGEFAQCNCLSGLINDLAKPIWRWTPALCQEERQQVLQAREKLFKKKFGCGGL
jgi:hypothetical protein